MTVSPAKELLVTASTELQNLGVNLNKVCDKRIIEIYCIYRSGIHPVTFLEALARLDEKAHAKLGPESYRSTWID